MKPGIRSTEFFAVLAFAAVALLSGLDISDGVVNFHINQSLMDDVKYIAGAYIGGRSVIKAVGVHKLAKLKEEVKT